MEGVDLNTSAAANVALKHNSVIPTFLSAENQLPGDTNTSCSTAIWNISCSREYRDRFPNSGCFDPSTLSQSCYSNVRRSPRFQIQIWVYVGGK